MEKRRVAADGSKYSTYCITGDQTIGSAKLKNGVTYQRVGELALKLRRDDISHKLFCSTRLFECQ